MLKNKLFISIGVVASLILSGGLYANMIIEKEHSKLEKHILSINENLKKYSLKITPLEKHNHIYKIFGTYRLEKQTNNKNVNYNLDLNYILNNPFYQYFFHNKIDLEGEIFFEGNFPKLLKYNKEPIKYVINYDKSGQFILKTEKKDIELIFPKPENYEVNLEDFLKENKKEGLLTKIDNFIFETAFHPEKSEEFSFNINANKIFLQDIEDLKDNLSIELPKIEYITDLHMSNINSLNLYSKKIYDERGELFGKNFLLKTGIKPNLPNYTAFLSSKIEELNIADQKNINLDFSASIQNIDEKIIDAYKKITTVYLLGEELGEEESLEIKNTISNNLLNGLSFSIDRINFKNPKNKINLNGKFEVQGIKEEDKNKFSLPTQSKFLFYLESEGELSEMINSIFVNSIDSKMEEMNKLEIPNSKKFINDKFKLELKYENSLLTVNNFPTPTMVNYFIFNWLSTINKELGFSSENDIIETDNFSEDLDNQNKIFKSMEESLTDINN